MSVKGGAILKAQTCWKSLSSSPYNSINISEKRLMWYNQSLKDVMQNFTLRLKKCIKPEVSSLTHALNLLNLVLGFSDLCTLLKYHVPNIFFKFHWFSPTNEDTEVISLSISIFEPLGTTNTFLVNTFKATSDCNQQAATLKHLSSHDLTTVLYFIESVHPRETPHCYVGSTSTTVQPRLSEHLGDNNPG